MKIALALNITFLIASTVIFVLALNNYIESREPTWEEKNQMVLEGKADWIFNGNTVIFKKL